MWYTDIARKRPLGTQTEARLRKRHKIILHTMVGSLWGTDSYFRSGGYSGTESHFGVGGDGETLQWQDDDYQADANLQGNDDCISIETADHGPEFGDWNTSGDNVPPWTAAQREKLAVIIARVATRHNIPIVLISDTRDSTRGIGYHRQGVDPYRTHGERYSNAFGKVCPGRRRIAQIPGIITRARQIAGGDTTPPEDDVSEKDVLNALASEQGQGLIANAMAGGLRDGHVVRREVAEIVSEEVDVKNPTTDEQWPLSDALWSMWYYSYWARVDAAANRAILEAQAAQGAVLSVEDTEAAKKSARVAVFQASDAKVAAAMDPETARELAA